MSRLSHRDQVIENLAESLFGVDMALDLVTGTPESQRVCSLEDLRRIYDEINLLMSRLSH